jgi:hypothetical protein
MKPGQSGRSVRLVRFNVGHLWLMSDPKLVMGSIERAADAANQLQNIKAHDRDSEGWN